MPEFKAKKEKPKIEEVARDFGVAHAEEAEAKGRMDKLRKLFFDLIAIPEDQLARQTIFIDGDLDPAQHVATLYPKWKIVKVEPVQTDDDEWKVIIQEDPTKKTFHFINPLDQKVYQRTVAESAPGIDLARIEQEDPEWFEAITFQPDPPPRELVALDQLTDEDKERLRSYLLPVKLTNRMEKPRPAKAEELEEIE